MIHIYGDSHAFFSFKNLKLAHKDHHQASITIFRVGRDNQIIKFDNNIINENDIIVLSYGEVDCRCHIQRQINNGRNEDDIINELVDKYFLTIRNNVTKKCKIIIVGIIPPTKQNDYETINGPILHEFPFVGDDTNRVRFTQKMNNALKDKCLINNTIYFNPYDYCTRSDGTLDYDFSDRCVHLLQNAQFLTKFNELYYSIIDS